ncbi:hypothetical protein Esi_0009_0172 [Ectocarpus siliculosus]|uniref:Uncharacterized protein n=1 Tax=Ectocarpus siliculosus TaxID=2880 RepID=D8LTU2_ECTSI|nr:hypothetical protein Esi_0009_0172 [Ectocarpus siliculosus]|eukprot:CBN73989.1 hypothetical protein Esi_0009_0172 [Ectocarpus siliculosus]
MKARGSVGKPVLRVDPVTEPSSPSSSTGTSARSTPKRTLPVPPSEDAGVDNPADNEQSVGGNDSPTSSSSMLFDELSSTPPLCSLSARLFTPPSRCCGNVKQPRRYLSRDVRLPAAAAGAMADDGVGSTAESPAVRGERVAGATPAVVALGTAAEVLGKLRASRVLLTDRTSGHPTTAPFDNRPEAGNRPCSTLRYSRRRHPRTRAMSTPSSPSRSTRCSTGKTRSSARRRRQHARGSHRRDRRDRRRRRRARRPRR